LALVPVPNPGARSVALKLSAACDRVTLRLWTANLVLVMELSQGPLAAGWGSIALPPWTLPNGLYFLTATAIQGARRTAPVPPVRLVLLR
jgi:hypothetical protein